MLTVVVEACELPPLPDDCCDAELPLDWEDCWELVGAGVADMAKVLCTSRKSEESEGREGEDGSDDGDGGKAEKGRNGNLGVPRTVNSHILSHVVTNCHTCFGLWHHAPRVTDFDERRNPHCRFSPAMVQNC